MTHTPFIIDCDTGRDDALAIWCVLSMHLPLAGVIASFGNTSVENVTDNTARVLALVGHSDLPLSVGAAGPLRHHRGLDDIVIPRQQVAGNGLCNVELARGANPSPSPSSPEQMAQWLVAIWKRNGGRPLDYVITGPATNCAAICSVFGTDARRYIGRITMMGGKLPPLWDEIPGPDFNLACDPFAVHDILAHGFVMHFVPMNATWPILLNLDEIEKLVPSTRIAATAQELMIAYCRHFAPAGMPLFRFHDPSAVLAAVDGSNFRHVSLDICCNETSHDFGRIMEGGPFHGALYEPGNSERQMLLKRILDALGFTTDAR